jgi:hypothetical protein
MGTWQLLDYPEAREVHNAFAASLRHLLAGKPAYLLHDHVLFRLSMETEESGGVRRRYLLLEPVAAIGETGQRDLERMRLEAPFKSDGLLLPSYEDHEATAQISALLTERAGRAFLEDVHDRLHK